jgi:hypothetical protein
MANKGKLSTTQKHQIQRILMDAKGTLLALDIAHELGDSKLSRSVGMYLSRDPIMKAHVASELDDREFPVRNAYYLPGQPEWNRMKAKA